MLKPIKRKYIKLHHDQNHFDRNWIKLDFLGDWSFFEFCYFAYGKSVY